MQDNAKCFVNLGQGIWEEITYEELEKRRKIIESYNKKKFIPLFNMLLEVSDEEYKEFYKTTERNKYIKKLEKELKIYSTDKMQEDEEVRDKQVFADNTDVELEVARRIDLEKLNIALMTLDNNEYELIKALFFQEKTVREYAKLLGIPFTTVQSRKESIINKLRKFF